ncbi:MAG: MerR family DNA-binding transcriptional regulator [Candidatus Falkowbacteria bacterium]|nr:MerR family DNA-binding transcriptional regulator [Candidatus Falkowbacteria bacterium]
MLNDNNKLIKINEAAKMLNVSMQTLRRWDQSGKLKAIRISPAGYRYYKFFDIQLIANNIFSLAENWILKSIAIEPDGQFFCIDSYTFQARLSHLENLMQKIPELEKDFSLISSIVGEIGNNSFDHNLGSWPDIRGIFFAYDLHKRQIVLADRGQGILTTLKRVCPELKNDSEALFTAFTKKISGRAPENRGNGLKYVKKVLVDIKKDIPLKLYFQSGNAFTILDNKTINLKIEQTAISFRGCLALINF